jgi:hypothetical protein
MVLVEKLENVSSLGCVSVKRAALGTGLRSVVTK